MKKRWLLGVCALFFIFTFLTKPVKAAVSVESFSVVTNKYGFHPSSGNYATFKVSVKSDQTNQSIRLRVLNSSGKYIYQKTVTNLGKKSYKTIKWDGKVTKGNTAGLAYGTYIKNGTYKVEVLAYGLNSSGNKQYSKKITTLKVSTSAASGSSGLKNVNYVPIYTGDASVDYLAEVMVKAAGVTSTLSQDAKTKRIYYWLAHNFYHVKYTEPLGTRFYNLSKLQTKIASYQKTVEKQVTAGTAVYSYYSISNIYQKLEYRCGVCNDTAAIFKILLNHVGIESVRWNGYYVNLSGKKSNHFWNAAVINGVTYYYDLDVELQNLGKVPMYYWYKETRKQSEKRHIFTKIE